MNAARGLIRRQVVFVLMVERFISELGNFFFLLSKCKAESVGFLALLISNGLVLLSRLHGCLNWLIFKKHVILVGYGCWWSGCEKRQQRTDAGLMGYSSKQTSGILLALLKYRFNCQQTTKGWALVLRIKGKSLKMVKIPYSLFTAFIRKIRKDNAS